LAERIVPKTLSEDCAPTQDVSRESGRGMSWSPGPSSWRQILVVPFLLFVGAIALYSPSFLSPDNILQVLRQVSIPGLIALGVTFVVICGRLDLSVGSLLSLTTVIVIGFHDRLGAGGAMAACVAMGVAVGAVNGVLVGTGASTR
jgi:ribose transport system permease protein